ncbi:Extracellular membrane protein, CFEM domain [Lasallia pustulata]|uniref:Extracellular membrane protein, CFEM domain n=1 Tax=Lasallia pustulata TaxID=136370 RepID=A0A1W5D681_9LECA|nr:Extracellular membrane protein, CFEM domain [Lasallia pustulata]
MKLSTILSVLGLIVFSRRATCVDETTAPVCVSKCWDNSKIVSTCKEDAKCFCDDGQFQNAVFQCLYSQCQTAQFGSALHHALAECSSFTSDVSDIPHLIRRRVHRKRDSPLTGYRSGYASASAVHSVYRRYASASAPANPRPTRSAATYTYSTEAITSTQSPQTAQSAQTTGFSTLYAFNSTFNSTHGLNDRTPTR